jgi:AcrR family transcriptional regulator
MVILLIVNKIDINKKEKENKLFETAFNLFTEKGIKDTSIQEIADKAGVGKGTFYLYFKDKYDLQEQLIAKKSYKLFHDALNELNKKNIENFDEQIIFIIDYVIDELTKNKRLLKFISKNLSFGLYNEKITKLIDENTIGVKETFLKGIKDNNVKLKNPEVTLFMIIELTSSTCFSCILKNEPLSIKEYKPYLYAAIKNLLNQK